MTDLASIAPASIAPASAALRGAGRRHAPLLILAAFAAAGVALGALDRPATMPEANLVLLLRFMAALKGAAALGAALLLAWRQGKVETTSPASPASAGLALAYGAGVALMALAPGLIWSLGPVAVGALCFHAGLILFAVAALRDDAAALSAGLRRRR